jgi:hypothetical protein
MVFWKGLAWRDWERGISPSGGRLLLAGFRVERRRPSPYVGVLVTLAFGQANGKHRRATHVVSIFVLGINLDRLPIGFSFAIRSLK